MVRRRAAPAGAFLLVRRVAATVFFDLWRVFPATAVAWISRPWLRVLRGSPKNNAPDWGAARMRCTAHFCYL